MMNTANVQTLNVYRIILANLYSMLAFALKGENHSLLSPVFYELPLVLYTSSQITCFKHFFSWRLIFPDFPRNSVTSSTIKFRRDTVPSQTLFQFSPHEFNRIKIGGIRLIKSINRQNRICVHNSVTKKENHFCCFKTKRLINIISFKTCIFSRM